MKSKEVPDILTTLRKRIGDRLHGLRVARGWTQARLARELGLSQARISVIERGGGSISGEQLLLVLRIFNVPVDTFQPPVDVVAEQQNALARLGALHLRESPDVPPTERYADARAAVVEILGNGDAARVISALAPVIVWNIDAIDLSAAHRELEAMGRGHRLGWLAANVRDALLAVQWRGPTRWAARGRRALVELDAFLGWALPRRRAAAGLIGHEDRLDTNLMSAKTVQAAMAGRSALAEEWGVVTVLTVEDFADALRGARDAV